MTSAPASSRRRTAATTLPWASSTTALRCGGGGLHVLAQHLGAALGHVGEDLVDDVLLDAAQGELELLLVDLAQHELQVAVLQDDEVLEGEQAQLDLVGQLLVGLADGADDVALGRAPRAVEDLGQGVDAAGGGELLADDVGELQAQALLDVADDVRVGLAHRARCAGRRRPAARAGARRARARRGVECTLATTSAMVCGDSSFRKAWTCSGGVRRRNSKGRVSGLAVTGADDLVGALGADELREHLAGEVGPADAAAEHVVAGEALLDLAHDGGARSPGARATARPSRPTATRPRARRGA